MFTPNPARPTARLLAGASLAALIVTPALSQTPARPVYGQLGEESVLVTATRNWGNPAAPDVEVSAATARQKINVVNTEDMLQFVPSLVVRKRHFGDTQDPIATRTSGVGSSARSLILVDGIMISTPLGNDNGASSPHFGIVAPQDVSHIDVLYGPYAAAYGGASIGAVVNITTRMPTRFEMYGHALGAVQNWRQYGSNNTLGTWQLDAGIGDKVGAFAWRLSLNHLVSDSQPLSLASLAAPAAPAATGTPVTGAIDGLDRNGAPTVIIGAAGLEHQSQDTGTLKAAYTFTNGWQLSYIASLFHQNDNAGAQTYLRDVSGAPVYAGALNIAGYPVNVSARTFSNGVYDWQQSQLAQGLSLKSDPHGPLTWSLTASSYVYLSDNQRAPSTALPGAATGGQGTITRMTGTAWYTLDWAGQWQGVSGHTLSFGLHRDATALARRTFDTTDWINGAPGAISNAAHGRTETNALWLQDIWHFAPDLKAALGVRLEDWRAHDGSNFNASPALAVTQPALSTQTVSPKLSLFWQTTPSWTLIARWGTAYRMPTVNELYQTVTTGTILSVPNPNLKPEHANSFELAARWSDEGNMLRLSLFQETVGDALLSQSAPLIAGSGVLYRYVQNIGQTQVQGIELAATRKNVLIPGLELGGSLTYADGRITRDATNAAAVNKAIPQLPRWRAKAYATYRIDRWNFTAGVRYSDPAFGTIENIDSIHQTWQGFGRYLVADLRAGYQVDDNWTVSAGIDNVNNAKYFLYHPFPQRTFIMEVRYER